MSPGIQLSDRKKNFLIKHISISMLMTPSYTSHSLLQIQLLHLNFWPFLNQIKPKTYKTNFCSPVIYSSLANLIDYCNSLYNGISQADLNKMYSAYFIIVKSIINYYHSSQLSFFLFFSFFSFSLKATAPSPPPPQMTPMDKDPNI